MNTLVSSDSKQLFILCLTGNMLTATRVTLLACLAARAIAVPLSASFPVAELQYILEQSEASILVSSGKFQTKSQQLLATELKSKPSYLQLQKHTDPNSEDEKVTLGDADPGEAAVMLYTSGTTNRPVR